MTPPITAKLSELGIPSRLTRFCSTWSSVVPSRMGVPTATVVAINRYKALSNYHRMTDTPENICWPTVASAADLAEHVVRELEPPAGSNG